MVKKNDAIALITVLLLVVLAIIGYAIFLLRRSAELEPLSSDGSVELGHGGQIHPRREAVHILTLNGETVEIVTLGGYMAGPFTLGIAENIHVK